MSRNKIKKILKKRQEIAESKISIEETTYQEFPQYLNNYSPHDLDIIIDELGANYSELFNESLEKINNIIQEYNSITIISILSQYGLTSSINNDGSVKSLLTSDFSQSHVELFQALILNNKIEKLGKVIPPPEIIQVIIDTLLDLTKAFSLMRLSSTKKNDSKKNKNINLLQENVRQHTLIVRNIGHYSQIIILAKELYKEFNEIIFEKQGFRIYDIIDVFSFMISTIDENLNNNSIFISQIKRCKNTKQMVYEYYKQIGEPIEDAEKFISHFNVKKRSREEIFFLILGHFNLSLHQGYTFDSEKISKELNLTPQSVSNLLNEMSYVFGDLITYNTDYIFLDNPVWKKPIIKFDNSIYYCAIPNVFFSFLFEIMDDIIKKYDKEKLNKVRSDFLEKKIEEIVKSKFPASTTVSNIKWKSKTIEYETDLITFIDSYAIIIEAKSGRISKTALRGAPDRLKRDIKKILIEPNLQSERLKNKILSLIKDPNLKDEIRNKLPVNLNQIKKILRVSISLENFAPIQANINNIKETGWLPKNFNPCPTMTITDFETIFDILEHPIQIMHYLEKRTEIENQINYLGDEIDLLGWYIDTLFNIEKLYGQTDLLILSEMSTTIDNYYMKINNDIQVDKPKIKLSDLFKKIIIRLEIRKPDRWTELGVILHRIPPNIQYQIEIKLKRLEKLVQKNWQINNHINTLVYSPPEGSEYSLAFLLYKNGNRNQRNELLENALNMGLEPKHVKFCILIAKNIDRNDLPYHHISLYEKKLN